MLVTREAQSLRMVGDKLVGTAVVYDQWSQVISEGGETFRERIAPGAFRNLQDNISFVIGHNDDATYADTQSGTLRLTDTQTALEFEADLPPYAQRLRELVGSGQLRGMSFRMDKIAFDRGDGTHTVREATIAHVSSVRNPAYPQTRVAIRSAALLRQKLAVRR